MNTTSLVLSSVLIAIPIFISYKESLELGKDIVISMARAVVQLLLVGYLLNVVFGLEKPIYIIILVMVMIFNAALNAKKKAGDIPHVMLISFVSISVGSSITMSVLVLSGALEFSPSQVIPTSGMIISNSMVAIGLGYRHLNASFKNNRDEVEVKLALGADIKEASKEIIRESIKVSIMPSIDSAKTLGIVSLPGMMTGLILGGASPLVAVKFQIMVTFMILSAASLSSILSIYLCYPRFFNARKQLKK